MFVAIGLIPYILCCVFSASILGGINQPIEIIEQTSLCINYLILYAICYIVFAMLRKALLQYLHTTLLIGFMFARLCIHLMIGYALFYYTQLGFYAFIISDSLSMCILLIVTGITLSRMINLTKFVTNLCKFSSAKEDGSTRSIMGAAPSGIAVGVGAKAGTEDGAETFHLDSPFHPDSQKPFKQYVSATLIPGTISCLEWWAVETFTFLVGALSYSYQSKENVFFTHACWASFLLIFQMPMLGLSVATAAIMTKDIRESKFYPAWYTFIQGLLSVVIYCVVIGILVCLGYDKILNMFFPIGTYQDLTNDDVLHNSFRYQVMKNSQDITVLFVISICGYSIAMCFLGLFVSVGRLARGGTFMLIGYYIFGLVLAIILGYIAEWKFYGIWFGFCSAFLVWCLLSALYWACNDWFNEMYTMKEDYDLMERKQKDHRKSHMPTNYGSTQQSGNTQSKPNSALLG